MYEGDYFEDMRHGHGTLKEQREAGDYEGPRFIEYTGEWEQDTFNGKGRLVVYESKQRMIKFEDHEGCFKSGVKDGLGRNIKLKDSEIEDLKHLSYCYHAQESAWLQSWEALVLAMFIGHRWKYTLILILLLCALLVARSIVQRMLPVP
jgi:hypothetical protein